MQPNPIGAGDSPPVAVTNDKVEVSRGMKIAAGLAMGVLIAGIVSTFFGHAHIADDGAGMFDNPFYSVGISAFVIGGIAVLGLAAFQLYKERSQQDPLAEKVKQGWRRALQVLGKAFSAIAATFSFTGRTLVSYIKEPLYLGLTLFLLGVCAIVFSKLHSSIYGTGLNIDDHVAIVGYIAATIGGGTLIGLFARTIHQCIKNKDNEEQETDSSKPIQTPQPQPESNPPPSAPPLPPQSVV